MEAMFKAGEFAKLCMTTKETLRHYDKLELLSPAAYAANGYKLYSVSQISDFALVTVLQSSGLSLSEIRDVLNLSDPDGLTEILEERVGVIEQQKVELERKQAALKHALDQAKNIRAWFQDPDVRISPSGYRWRITYCPEEYFLDASLGYAEGEEGRFVDAVKEHLGYCRKQGWPVGFQSAYRIDAEAVEQRDYAQGLCVEVRISECIDSDRVHSKPAGWYVQWLNQFDFVSAVTLGQNPLFAAYDALQDFAKEQDWHFVGDLYDAGIPLFGGVHSKSSVVFTEVSMRIDGEPSQD